MKRIALRILALMLVWAIIPSTRAQESKTLYDFRRSPKCIHGEGKNRDNNR